MAGQAHHLSTKLSESKTDHRVIEHALEKAHEDRDISLTFIKVEPRWDPYRDDPRFVSGTAYWTGRKSWTGFVRLHSTWKNLEVFFRDDLEAPL